MSKRVKILSLLLVIAIIICAFFIFRKGDDTMNNNTNIFDEGFPKQLKDIPSSYFRKASKQGTLEDLYYDTYESFSYASKTNKLRKHANVYLPYGYDKNKKYPVVYMMHGGWSNENTYFGNKNNTTRYKNVFDHAIANKEMSEVIVVLPTYNNTSGNDSADYNLALQLTDNYHNELNNDLIPMVDKTYSTIANREHRAFIGFSMGSITTWRTLEHSLDYFKYFMPSSGGPALSARAYDTLIKNSKYGENDFFIFAASGTKDFAYSGFKNGINEMINLNNSIFKYSNNEEKGNIYYLEKEGAVHDGDAAMLYFYNGVSSIWKK